ncbi:MAG TPA: hypothetical protein VMT53_20825 [Terriglobales bacterium]|nr:hypothetical protein [Terriglobales bacterium]
MISSLEEEEKQFTEFRHKVRSADVLSAAVMHLMRAIRFTGRVSVVVQNGRVLKSGYEEGYFCSHPNTTSA